MKSSFAKAFKSDRKAVAPLLRLFPTSQISDGTMHVKNLSVASCTEKHQK